MPRRPNWPLSAERRAKAHIVQLAEKMKIEIHWSKTKWQAQPTARMVWVPTPGSPERYYVALHELGHIGSKTAQRTGWGDEPGITVLVEGAAWAWAAMMADRELVGRFTDDDWMSIVYHFGTYLASAAETPLEKAHHWI